MSPTTFSLSNKCYNGILYPCQCLELGYLIRYQSGDTDPQPAFFLNGEEAPTCSEEPACTGVTTTDSTTVEDATTIAGTTAGHICESDPCHPDAFCDEDGDNHLCICPPNFNKTGVDLYDSSSNETACEVLGSDYDHI